MVISTSDDHTVRFWDFAEYAQEQSSTSARDRFASELEALRIRHLRPTSEVAAEIGISPSTLWSWVHGRSLPRSEELLTRAEHVLSMGSWTPPGRLVGLYRTALREKRVQAGLAADRKPQSKPVSDEKDYDIFVSYAHRDRQLVQDLAQRLHQQGVRLWYDRWEMAPGDVLRDRISDGITRAKHFMALISKSSLESNWVKYELNSGMIEEIESGSVKVIPCLVLGLHRRICRTTCGPNTILTSGPAKVPSPPLTSWFASPSRMSDCERSDLNDFGCPRPTPLPWKRGRRLCGVRIRQLHSPRCVDSNSPTVGRRRYDCGVLVDQWHMSVLEPCFRARRRRHVDGGMLALTASLLVDPQYFVPKLRLIGDFLDGRDASGSAELHAYIDSQSASHDRFPTRVAEAIQILGRSDDDDIRHGSVLCRAVQPSWGGTVPAPDQDQVVLSMSYADVRLPGISGMAAKSAWTAQ